MSFWATEAIGIMDEGADSLNEILSDVQFNNGQYVVHLPWEKGHFKLLDHFSISMSCLLNLQRCLLKNPKLQA